MKQLMIQVERIVRPVRAMESRKLQMRRELLAHLQLAVAEEVGRGQDEASAVDAAVRRLGEPAELTKQLQRTVPWIQRILLANMSGSPAVARCEEAVAVKLYGVGPITLTHISILCTFAGLLSGLPYFMNPVVRNSLNHSGISPAHPAVFFLSLLVIWQAIYLFSCRLVFGSADSIAPFNKRRLVKQSAILLALQCLMTFASTETAMDRLPTVTEVTSNVGATILLMAISVLAARGVAVLRGRYTEWLTLNLA